MREVVPLAAMKPRARNCPRPEGCTRKVSWGANQDIGALGGKEVRLKFIFSRSRLYSFKIK